MQEYRLKRMTRDDLIFQGECIATANDREQTNRRSSWLELTLYRTSVGRYVLATSLHMFQFLENKNHHGAVAFASADLVHDFLVTEGKGLADIIGRLLLEAARSDPAFSHFPGFDGKNEDEEATRPSATIRRRHFSSEKRLRREGFKRIHSRRPLHT